MIVGSGIIDLRIWGCRSLKEKRGIISRIIKRTQHEFNISIAEVGDNDNWKRARIGFCVVGNDSRYINSKIDHIFDFIENLQIAEIVNSKFEITSYTNWMDSGDYEEEKYDAF
jgi:uncharacterized protein YlxP (DUF503 family)